MDGLYINDFHRSNSMAALREVKRMSLHPYSREQKLRQIETLHLMATTSKETANEAESRAQSRSVCAMPRRESEGCEATNSNAERSRLNA